MSLRRPLVLVFASCLCAFTQAQDPTLKDSFIQGKALWATQGDREAAASRFEKVLEALAPKAATLDAGWAQVLCETYNWLAVLDDRSPATKPRAQARLQALIDFNPDFDVDRALTSQRLATIFDRLKAEKFVPVKLSYAPEGGTLLLDGKRTTALLRKFVTFGSHTFSYARPGHATAEVTLDLAPRDAKSADFKLTRVASTLTFYVQPSGAEVFLDGQSLGFTKGAAGSEAALVAVPAGLRPEELSEGFVIPELKPGKHLLELKSSCFRLKRLELGESLTTPLADHVLEAIRLEPSKGTLSVQSNWPGGELFLSGQGRGMLPASNLAVCSGLYDLMVRFPAGGFSQRIVVEEGKALSLEVRPKPRIAFLGLEGEGDFTGKARFLTQLSRLGERLESFAFLLPKAGERPAEALARVKASKEAELILQAIPVADKVVHQVTLILSTPEGEEERLLVKPLEQDPLEVLVTRMNTMPPLQEPGLGLALLDLTGEPGPWVLSAQEPALKAGIEVGKRILLANDKPVSSVLDLRLALQGAKEIITLSQGGSSLSLPILKEAVEIHLASAELSYPAVLAQLRLQYQGAKGDPANLIKLNIGLALMHFRKYDKAIEMLRDAHLSTIRGVCQGTLDYHTGVCFLRLGRAYAAEAAQAFRQALKYPQATLFGPDGPLVAPLAKQALDDLK